jgi:hypothetical protein
MITLYTKDPNATKDYGWTWSTFLGADTIASSAWLINGIALATWMAIIPTPTFTGASATNTTTTTTIWLAGGTLHTSYLVTNRITTAAGRIEDKTFMVKIKEQ